MFATGTMSRRWVTSAPWLYLSGPQPPRLYNEGVCLLGRSRTKREDTRESPGSSPGTGRALGKRLLSFPVPNWMSFPWLLGQRTTPRVASGTEMSSLPALEAGRPTPRRQGGWAPSGGRAFLTVPSSQRQPVTLGCDCSPSPPPPCRQVASPLRLRLFSCPSRTPLPSGPNSMRPHLNALHLQQPSLQTRPASQGPQLGLQHLSLGTQFNPEHGLARCHPNLWLREASAQNASIPSQGTPSLWPLLPAPSRLAETLPPTPATLTSGPPVPSTARGAPQASQVEAKPLVQTLSVPSSCPSTWGALLAKGHMQPPHSLGRSICDTWPQEGESRVP